LSAKLGANHRMLGASAGADGGMVTHENGGNDASPRG